MARLPTVESFGSRPTPRSQRGVVSFRADIAENAEVRAAGQATDPFGDLSVVAINVSEGIERQKLAKARSDFLVGKVELDAEFANDQDFETSDERYAKRIGELKATTSEGLFGKSAANFTNQTDLDIARGVATNQGNVFVQRQTHNLAELSTMLDTNRTAMLTAQDPEARASLLDTSNDAITSMVEQGFLDEVDGEKMKRDTAIDYAVTAVSMQPPEVQHQMLGIPEGWSPGDKLPPRKKNGTLVDFIDEAKRVELARKAMPGVNARVAVEETARILDDENLSGDLEKQLDEAKKIKNPTVMDDVTQRLKAEYTLQKALDAEDRVQSAREDADAIIKSGLGSSAMFEAVGEIEDAEQQAAVRKLVKQHLSEQDYLTKKDLDEKANDAVGLAREGRFEEISDEVLAELGGPMAATLERISSSFKRGAPVDSKPEVENKLNGMDVEELAAVNLLDEEYVGGLSANRWQVWSDRQGSISKAAEPTTPAVRTALRTRVQIVKSDLDAAGVTSDKKVNQFNTMLDELIGAYEAEAGKKAGSAEIQGFVDHLLIEGEKTGMIIDPDIRLFEAGVGDEFFIEDVDQIPTKDLAPFKASMEKSLGRAASDDEVVEAYNDWLRGTFLGR